MCSKAITCGISASRPFPRGLSPDPADLAGPPFPVAAPATTGAGLYLGGFAGANFLAEKTLGLGGLELGYSYQVGRFVFGPRIDAFWRPDSSESFYQWTPAPASSGSGFGRGGSRGLGAPAQFQAANHVSASFFSTVVGRFGYEVSDNFLPYFTAGLVASGLSMDTSVTGSMPSGRWGFRQSDLPPRRSARVYSANSLNQTRTGLTAGGGFEYRLTRNWSLQLDYKYFAFPKVTLETPAYANGVQVTGFRLWDKGWGNILSLGAIRYF
ncbi:outer membrane beta-barrel protein [Rhodoblastus sp.]|uniref:outer membrane protein n=1 Tax=Rhodoblastus sp. TaxID=1962975 RepID=UPI00261A9A76|nr:outer membrane beta-barrel protein [Rhodoblastus sp.]